MSNKILPGWTFKETIGIGIVNLRGITGFSKRTKLLLNNKYMITEINYNQKENWVNELYFGVHLYLVKENEIAICAQNHEVTDSIIILRQGKLKTETWHVFPSQQKGFPLVGLDNEHLILPMIVRPFTEEEKLIKNIIE